MSDQIKNGKKPLSSKPSVVTDDLFGNPLALSDELKKELEDQGLEARFIDAKKLYDMGGYHDKGWVPYKIKSNVIMESMGFQSGTDPEGVIRRGSLILAVKTKEQAQRHRDFLKQKAERASQVNSAKAEELRKAIKDSGLNAKVIEGYEDNE